jgi:uncharacterized protein YcfJ
MIRLAQVLGLGLGLAVAGSAAAWHDDNYGPEYDTARVVSVDPILDRYDEPVSREVCWNEPVEYYEPRYAYRNGRQRDNTAGTVLGAIIGGALGNQVGRGDGRRAATIAGAVIGGAIGHSESRRRGSGYYETGGSYRRGSERRCDVQTDYRSNERVVGYDVGYEYNGRVYHTRTDYHPGNTIRVQVQVDAVP